MDVFSVRRFTIATGLSRSIGLACCSTVAKQELRSICITSGRSALYESIIVISLASQVPRQTFRIELKTIIRPTISHVKYMHRSYPLRARVTESYLTHTHLTTTRSAEA